MGRYSRKDMIEFANFAKSYQSSPNVEQAYEAYLKGARLKKPNWKNTPLYLMQQANVAYIDDMVVKNRYGDVDVDHETHFYGVRMTVESWDEDKRILKLKSVET